jgi:Mg-chelatase subunit ChlD
MTRDDPLGIERRQATLTASFEYEAYPAGHDPVVRLLIEATVNPLDRPASNDNGDVSRERAGPDVELFLVLDVSGSMDASDRYPLLRQALATLLEGVRPGDRVGVDVFSDGAQLILPSTPGEQVRRSVREVLDRMDGSPRKFGGATLLRPGLDLARTGTSIGGDTVRRTIILTDGEIHDPDECSVALAGFRGLGIEVAAYGFGAQFQAASLRQLLSDQLGGWVKPICRVEDIVATFGHIADVQSNLVAPSGLFTLEFADHVDVGGAWTFRPQERYLGPVQGRRLTRELGGIEAGRTYSLLVEARVPPHDAPRTPIGSAALSWRRDGQVHEERIVIEVPRSATKDLGPACRRVGDVVRVLEGLRQPHEHAVQTQAARARLTLALAEGRDPGLIEALEKQLDVLEGRRAPTALSAADVQYLQSDESTCVSPPSALRGLY